MPDQTFYILKEVAGLTGAKPRSLQLWADAGVLQPLPKTNRAGSGTHRHFPKREVEIAAVLVPLARLGATIGKLKRFATRYRKLRTKQLKGVKQAKRDLRVLQRAQAGDGINYLIYYDSPDEGSEMHFMHADPGVPISFKPSPNSAGAVLINLNEVWRRLRERVFLRL